MRSVRCLESYNKKKAPPKFCILIFQIIFMVKYKALATLEIVKLSDKIRTPDIQNNILGDSYGLTSLSNSIKNNRLTGITNADVDELFALYW